MKFVTCPNVESHVNQGRSNGASVKCRSSTYLHPSELIVLD